MKTLTILVLMQSIILLFLLGKIVLVEEETTVAGHAEPSASDDSAYTQSKNFSNGTFHYPDDDRLRQIIREELRAELDGRYGSDKQMNVVIPSNSMDTAENQNQRDLVAQQLEYHTSVGTITNMDMQKLQGEFAKLDEASRKEILSKLSRALNSGQLEARL